MPGIETLLRRARSSIHRVEAADLPARLAAGAWLIDLRPLERRQVDGHVPGAVVIDRLVLEWRLDPRSAYRLRPGPGLDDEVYLLCNEGYASSLAARDLRELGFSRAGDVIDGFAGWEAAGLPVVEGPPEAPLPDTSPR
jgi:rhodanese-related sulfurtransferase